MEENKPKAEYIRPTLEIHPQWVIATGTVSLPVGNLRPEVEGGSQ
jgi:hypothetical protein